MTTNQTSAFDRFNEALRGLDDQFHDMREQFDERRQSLERDVRQRAEEVQTQVRKSSLYKRATRARRDWEEQVDRTRTSLYDVFGLATKSEVDRLNRKLNTISRKLNDLTKEFKREGDEEIEGA